MEALTQLRKLARERRDKSIAMATDQYVATLSRIAALEQDLLGQQHSMHQRASTLVRRAIPSDRPFSTIDVLATLEAMDPSRAWYNRTITNQLGRLRTAGVIRRLRRPTRKAPALYVRTGVETEPTPFEDQTMRDAAAHVLRGRSMNVTELTLAILAAGFKTKMGKRGLRSALAVAMRRNRQRFTQSGGKWAVS